MNLFKYLLLEYFFISNNKESFEFANNTLNNGS